MLREEVGTMISHIDSQRNGLIAALMLDCGLRSAEVVDLTPLSFDWNRHMLYVVGKFSKERMVGYPNYIHHILLDYHRRAYLLHPTRSHFFTTTTGGRVDTRHVRRFVKSIGQRAGLSNIHPHMLRHTFATQYYDETRNIIWLSKVLGHEGIASTQVYMHCVMDEAITHMKERR
jgi:integrase/recombinase XerC